MAPDMSSDSKPRRVKFWYIKEDGERVLDRGFWDIMEAELAAQDLAKLTGHTVFLLEAIMSVRYAQPKPQPTNYIWQDTCYKAEV